MITRNQILRTLRLLNGRKPPAVGQAALGPADVLLQRHLAEGKNR